MSDGLNREGFTTEPQPAHPLDLPAMAAFAANYGLSGDQAARRWATAVKNVREHFRIVADAAITASQIGIVASPTAEDSGSAAEITRLRGVLREIERITDWANDNDDDTLSIEHVRDMARNGLKGGPAEPQPAPEPAALVDAHFVGNGPYPLLIVCLTENASDVECGQEIADVEPGVSWGHLEALLAEHATQCHAQVVTATPAEPKPAPELAADPFGVGAFTGHGPGCGCDECEGARSDAAADEPTPGPIYGGGA